MNVNVYTEYLNDNWEWVCEQAPTLSGTVYQPEMASPITRVKKRTAGLLCMGAGKTSYPFSWGQRGFPLRVSKEVFLVFDGSQSKDQASHINLDEMRTKRMELLVIHGSDCPDLSKDLGELIDAFPESDRKAHFRRMVFWFN